MKRTSIKRRTPLKRGRKRAAFDRAAAQLFAAKARAQGCLMCGTTLGIDAHHAIRAQHVRRAARAMGIDETRALYDLRNVVGLCRAHHAAHHAHTARVPRRLPAARTVLRRAGAPADLRSRVPRGDPVTLGSVYPAYQVPTDKEAPAVSYLFDEDVPPPTPSPRAGTKYSDDDLRSAAQRLLERGHIGKNGHEDTQTAERWAKNLWRAVLQSGYWVPVMGEPRPRWLSCQVRKSPDGTWTGYIVVDERTFTRREGKDWLQVNAAGERIRRERRR